MKKPNVKISLNGKVIEISTETHKIIDYSNVIELTEEELSQLINMRPLIEGNPASKTKLLKALDLVIAKGGTKDQEKRIVRHSPLAGLRCLSRFLFTRQIHEEVFCQQIEDAEEEYFAVLQAGEMWHARWIRLRGYLTFFMAFSLQVWVSVGKLVWSIFRGLS